MIEQHGSGCSLPNTFKWIARPPLIYYISRDMYILLEAMSIVGTASCSHWLLMLISAAVSTLLSLVLVTKSGHFQMFYRLPVSFCWTSSPLAAASNWFDLINNQTPTSIAAAHSPAFTFIPLSTSMRTKDVASRHHQSKAMPSRCDSRGCR